MILQKYTKLLDLDSISFINFNLNKLLKLSLSDLVIFKY